MTKEPLIELIYVSAATGRCDAAELGEILTQARQKNQRLGVTGMLLAAHGSFLQILEGPEPVVNRLYETIARDPRHERVLRLFLTPIEARSCGEWTMGYVDGGAAGAAQAPGLNDFFRSGFDRLHFVGGERDRAREIALQFKKGRWRQYVQTGSTGERKT